jgi:hypothetical protein
MDRQLIGYLLRLGSVAAVAIAYHRYHSRERTRRSQ